MPLERDEGEYAYAGQLILEGIPPYSLACNMKLPGTYTAYALIMTLLGQTPSGIHGGLTLINAGNTILVFLLARRLVDSAAGIVAAASYSVLAMTPSLLGFAAHATHFVVLAALSGLLLLLYALRSGRGLWFICSGAFFGVAFVMKQPGFLFVVFGFLYLCFHEWKTRAGWGSAIARIAKFSGGAVLPFALTCLWLWKAGVFPRFWFWTFTYARQYGTTVSVRDAPQALWFHTGLVAVPALLLWIVAAAGLLSTFLIDKARTTRWFTASFLLFSFLAVCPGFYFREHYFILMLPAVSLLAGVGVSFAGQWLRDNQKLRRYAVIPFVVFVGAMAVTVYGEREFLFEMDPIAACRSIYGSNPFPEAVKIADFLQRNTKAADSIAVMGSEPEIYFYSHRHSATGQIYTYSLMEQQPYALRMQNEMIADLEKARPQFIVLVGIPTSWAMRPGSQTFLFDWTAHYLNEGYKLDGIVDILDESQYRWGEAAETYTPISPYTVRVFKRL